MTIITTALIIFVSITFGYYLRDLKEARHIIRTKLEAPKHSALIDYEPPITEQQTAEQQARANALDNR